jgi:hypothetical protein
VGKRDANPHPHASPSRCRRHQANEHPLSASPRRTWRVRVLYFVAIDRYHPSGMSIPHLACACLCGRLGGRAGVSVGRRRRAWPACRGCGPPPPWPAAAPPPDDDAGPPPPHTPANTRLLDTRACGAWQHMVLYGSDQHAGPPPFHTPASLHHLFMSELLLRRVSLPLSDAPAALHSLVLGPVMSPPPLPWGRSGPGQLRAG